jgi:hypothetical protein
MNERIKKLAEQAGIEFTYDPTETPMRAFAECWEDELEKFAQSIVKECAELCLTNETFEGMFHKMEYRRGRHFNTIIKQHFGVE